MKEGQVTLSLSKYDRLKQVEREFKEFKEGKAIVYTDHLLGKSVEILTEAKALEELQRMLSNANCKIEELIQEIVTLKTKPSPTNFDRLIEEVTASANKRPDSEESKGVWKDIWKGFWDL